MKKKHVILILLVLVVVFMLTGCSGADKSMLPISNPNAAEKWNRDGWFVWLLVRPIAFLIDRFSIGGVLAIGIILTTLMVRTIAWPVYAKTNDMSLKMTLAQPEMTRIQAKYANRQDPISQQKMQREMMAVWKKYKINPLGCLVAPLIQFPLFMAMYNAVQRYPNNAYTYPEGHKYAGMTKTVCTWFKHKNNSIGGGDLKTKFCGIDLAKGITDIKELGKISNWVYIILPILVGVTMVACQLVSQKKPAYAKKAYPNQQESAQAKQTQKMMRFMMIFMTAMMVLMSFRSGTLALYWVVGNLYTIVQTIVNRKTNEIKWEKAQSTNTITGVKVKVEVPKKEKKEKPVKEPKSKDTKKDVKEEKVETKELDTTNDEAFDEVVNTNKDEIVDAEFEEIDNSENKDN
ncbi:MAG: YidC/Oxa1 family membrane protein insertase [bacterium]|nr:YidC/Oxa1 family membrane protein insertase [bacterium]